MRFLRKEKIKKTVLVISDIHLGAGIDVNGQRNYLEDFHYDKEMVEFLRYYSTGEYFQREVELIINGDLLDFLAVPFVPFFDDEFWSEDAALEKLKLILVAHEEVMKAMVEFISHKKKRIVYVIGNHDAEMILPRVQAHFLAYFPVECRDQISILCEGHQGLEPVKGVIIRHGHEYELAHQFDPQDSLIQDENGRLYFVPPWGSYYVTRVINKFKEERPYINAVRPIKKFIINGLIYDTVFTVRFMLANFFYFIMVRMGYVLYRKKRWRDVIQYLKEELKLFQNYEDITRSVFMENPHIKVLIVGHTHEPIFRPFADGTIFINTGTWTNMYNLDFGKTVHGESLTYAQIDVKAERPNSGENNFIVNLHQWHGIVKTPYSEFS